MLPTHYTTTHPPPSKTSQKVSWAFELPVSLSMPFEERRFHDTVITTIRSWCNVNIRGWNSYWPAPTAHTVVKWMRQNSVPRTAHACKHPVVWGKNHGPHTKTWDRWNHHHLQTITTRTCDWLWLVTAALKTNTSCDPSSARLHSSTKWTILNLLWPLQRSLLCFLRADWGRAHFYWSHGTYPQPAHGPVSAFQVQIMPPQVTVKKTRPRQSDFQCNMQCTSALIARIWNTV